MRSRNDVFDVFNVSTDSCDDLQISVEAAYLYDAVHLYARCVLEAIESGDDPKNGTAAMAKFAGSHYKSALG